MNLKFNKFIHVNNLIVFKIEDFSVLIEGKDFLIK